MSTLENNETPTFYLIDRNMYILLEKKLKGIQDENESVWVKAKSKFAVMDKKKNVVSIILSIIEGKPTENRFERQLSIVNEANFLNNFFVHATTDYFFLTKLSDEIANMNLGKQEYHFSLYMKLYEQVCKMIAGGVKKEKISEVESSIFESVDI